MRNPGILVLVIISLVFVVVPTGAVAVLLVMIALRGPQLTASEYLLALLAVSMAAMGSYLFIRRRRRRNRPRGE